MQRVDDALFNDVFETVIHSPSRKPAAWLPRRLTPLFIELQRKPPKTDPDELAELIWALWIHSTNESADAVMNGAIEAMAAGAFDLARPMLDNLVKTYPDWSEAWNKRATIAFAEKRDADALADIRRTLEIEPRHFGAMIGFAQICVRHSHLSEAKAGFEMAARIHPHIPGLAAIIEDLSMSQHLKH